MPESDEHRFRHDPVLELVLHLPEFWRIREVKVTERPPEELAKDMRLTRPRGQMDVYLETVGGRLPCPVCSAPSPRHSEREERVWEDLPIRDYRLLLHARPPRVNCPEHGVHTVGTPWAPPKSGFTYDVEFRMLDLAKEMPILKVAEALWVGRHRVERVVHRWISFYRRHMRMDHVTAIAIDEKAVQKGHRYVSVVTDQDTHQVLFATPGRGGQVLGEFAAEMTRHGGDPRRIRYITMDMSAAYESGAAANFPNAEVVFDKFHIISHMQQAVDEVRREEQRTAPGLKKTRWLWLRNPVDLTKAQEGRLTEILPRYRHTGRAYNLRLELQEAMNGEPKAAIVALKRWFFRATHSRLEPVIDVAYMIKRHWDGVVRAIQTGLTNAIAEGRNSVIQLAKQRARGFRHVQTFINAIFLVSSPIDRSLITLAVQ